MLSQLLARPAWMFGILSPQGTSVRTATQPDTGREPSVGHASATLRHAHRGHGHTLKLRRQRERRRLACPAQAPRHGRNDELSRGPRPVSAAAWLPLGPRMAGWLHARRHVSWSAGERASAAPRGTRPPSCLLGIYSPPQPPSPSRPPTPMPSPRPAQGLCSEHRPPRGPRFVHPLTVYWAFALPPGLGFRNVIASPESWLIFSTAHHLDALANLSWKRKSSDVEVALL